MRSPRALLLATLPLLLSCTSPEQRFADHVERGGQYAAEGELRKAVLEYQSALKIRPDDPEINERMGDLLREQRSPQDAAFFYREAFRLDPTRTGAALKEARTLILRDPRRAGELVARALQVDPEDPVAHRTRSELALAQGDLEAAREAADKAVELAADDPASWMQLGRVHQGRIREARASQRPPGDDPYAAAIAAFVRADEVAGGSVYARIEQARTLGSRRATRDRAAAVYRSAVELAFEQPELRTRAAASDAVADYASRAGDAELERWALRKLVEAAPGRLDAWSRLGAVQEDAQGSERIYAELLAKRPADPLAHITYANFLLRSRRSEDAIAHLEEALEDGVESPLMWEQLLRVRIARRRIADARGTYVRMAEAFPDDPITRRGEARLALVTGRTAQAVEILRKLVLEDETAESQLLLAQAEQRGGDLRRALAAVDRGIALEPGFSRESMELKARIHFEGREWGPTLRALNEIAARGQTLSGRYRVMRASALYELGRTRAAREALLRALDDPRPQPSAAIEYAEREGEADPEGARAHLEKSLESHPTHPGLLARLTEWDLREGRGEAALARLNQVIESHRVEPAVLLLRAELLARQGDVEAAEADALRAFEVAPESPEALDLLFHLYAARGDAQEAIRSFQEAEEAGVLHAGARLLLGRLHLHAGDVPAARRMFEKVLEADPEMASAQSDLAFLLAQQGEDLDRALSLARQANQRLEGDPGVTHSLGYVYLRSGRNEAALAELRRARELADRPYQSGLVPPIYYHMGLALRALERDQEAIQAFETALALDADFPDAAAARREIDGLRRQRENSS